MSNTPIAFTGPLFKNSPITSLLKGLMLATLPMLPCSDLGGRSLFMFACNHTCQKGILMACPRASYSAPLINQSSTEQLSHSIHIIFNLRADLAICNLNVQSFHCQPPPVILALQKHSRTFIKNSLLS